MTKFITNLACGMWAIGKEGWSMASVLSEVATSAISTSSVETTPLLIMSNSSAYIGRGINKGYVSGGVGEMTLMNKKMVEKLTRGERLSSGSNKGDEVFVGRAKSIEQVCNMFFLREW